MSNRTVYIIAGSLLLVMFSMAFGSVVDDSFTFDETAHITAGYSYLIKGDMRLNPEHPPLIKDLAAFPLLFLNLNFPDNHSAWLQQNEPLQWWLQFDVGHAFLYESGNNPDKILLFGRLPLIILLTLIGWFLFYWTKKLFGANAALLTLFLFAFSPTLIAHGRLVTTDVGAAFGVMLATAFFLNFLQNPSRKNIIFAGLAFGAAQLIKFNLILLYPFLGLVLLSWVLIKTREKKLKTLFILCIKFAALLAVAWILIWAVYALHVQNLPMQKQVADVQYLTKDHPLAKIVSPITVSMSKNNITRPWGYYLLGVAMTTQRAAGGNNTYFMGEISAAGWIQYFPTVYAIKEPLAFHLLTIWALVFAAIAIKRPFWQEGLKRLREWIFDHFAQFAMLLWLAIYWAASLSSNLNIGMRHLIPTLPFTYALVAWATIQWVNSATKFKKVAIVFIAFLLSWQAATVINNYPNFISYFNELAGGPAGGTQYVVDSNSDWGQDLKRLAKFVEQNNIDKIKIAYFGGGDPKYYMGDKVEYFNWEEPQKGWIAISATALRGGQAVPAPGFNEPTDKFYWLYPYKPVTVIGNSIFVYNIR